MGVAGEREKVDDVVDVDGGERSDFKGMLIGFANAHLGEGTEEVEDDGESDRSLLLSLMLSLLLSSDIICRVENDDAMAMVKLWRER